MFLAALNLRPAIGSLGEVLARQTEIEEPALADDLHCAGAAVDFAFACEPVAISKGETA